MKRDASLSHVFLPCEVGSVGNPTPFAMGFPNLGGAYSRRVMSINVAAPTTRQGLFACHSIRLKAVHTHVTFAGRFGGS